MKKVTCHILGQSVDCTPSTIDERGALIIAIGVRRESHRVHVVIEHSGHYKGASVRSIAVQYAHHGHEHVPHDDQSIENRILHHIRWSQCMALVLFSVRKGLSEKHLTTC